jgi:hypothetical protein
MRRSFTVIASILAGCLIVGLLLSRITVSQVAPTVQPQSIAGRYQVAIGADASTGGAKIVVCDTTTGQCWTQGGGGRGGADAWRDLGKPTDAKWRGEDGVVAVIFLLPLPQRILTAC